MGLMRAEHFRVGGDRREDRYDTAVGAVVPPVCSVMAVVVAVLAVANLVLTAGHTRTVTVALATGTALALVGLRLWLVRHRLPRQWAHPVLVTIVAVCAVDSMVHLYLAPDERLTSNAVLLVVGTGALVLDRRWLVGALAFVWATWGVAIAAVPVPTGRWHWVLAMAGATVLGVFLGAMRRSTVDELSTLLERAERAAVQDDLTGLLNRRGLAMVGEQVVAAARRSGNAVHCVFVDVDGLKDVNDRLGHLAGDRVLLAVADAVRLSVRGGDVVARWGGDEFCVLGPGPGTAPVDLERRIVARVQELPPDDVPGWLARVSAGSAMLAPWDDGDLASLLDQADREMYRRRSLRREAQMRPSRPVHD
jgi:diguanylate cyclase (GGDEF)-like protein